MISTTACKKMIDQHGRNIDYLRISVTDRCNLRCIYCMPECGVTALAHDDILTYEEIERICRVMAGMGLKKIKLTGGEPLLRPDFEYLVARLKAVNGIESVTVTTNGVLLGRKIKALHAAGIDAVNISLDTVSAQSFARITRRDLFKDVWESIQEALKYPDIPLKINCVPMDDEPEHLIRMAAIAKDLPIHVRFIEMMPIGFGKAFDCCSEETIVHILEKAFGPLTPVTDVLGNGPCHYYSIEGFQGYIGFISAISHKFCTQCNRVRLTAEGFLKTCLQYETGSPLRDFIRCGCSDEALSDLIARTIDEKPACHHFEERTPLHSENKTMSQIGG